MSIRDRGAEVGYRQRDGRRRRYRIFPALVVIGFGAYFLLGNLGYDLDFFHRNNWWAWLILLAAASPLIEAGQRFREAGRIDGVVLHFLLTAAAIVMLALMFILSLSWQLWWPVFVIYGGLCMLVRGWRPAIERPVD